MSLIEDVETLSTHNVLRLVTHDCNIMYAAQRCADSSKKRTFLLIIETLEQQKTMSLSRIVFLVIINITDPESLIASRRISVHSGKLLIVAV